MAQYERILAFLFQDVLLVLGKCSFWQGDCELGYHSMKFRHFPEISQFPQIQFSAVWQLVKQLVYIMFIRNNGAPFHLWCKENLVKRQKVSKCYENDIKRP